MMNLYRLDAGDNYKLFYGDPIHSIERTGMYNFAQLPDCSSFLVLSKIIKTLFASMFYWIVFQMVIGTKRVELLDNCDINHTWQGRVVHVAGVVALFNSRLIVGMELD